MTLNDFQIKIDPELENAVRAYTDHEWQDLEDSMKKTGKKKDVAGKLIDSAMYVPK